MMVIPLAVEARVESRPDFPKKMHLKISSPNNLIYFVKTPSLPPDFLAVVVADKEGDGEEEHHDGAQNDYQHLLIGQPTLGGSEIVKYDPLLSAITNSFRKQSLSHSVEGF